MNFLIVPLAVSINRGDPGTKSHVFAEAGSDANTQGLRLSEPAVMVLVSGRMQGIAKSTQRQMTCASTWECCEQGEGIRNVVHRLHQWRRGTWRKVTANFDLIH